MNKVKNKLRVYHYPQVPCKPFLIEVKDEEEAAKVIKVLAEQHLWLFQNNFIGDYANSIGVSMWEDEAEMDENDDKWVNYWNEKEMMEWEELEEEYFNNN